MWTVIWLTHEPPLFGELARREGVGEWQAVAAEKRAVPKSSLHRGASVRET